MKPFFCLGGIVLYLLSCTPTSLKTPTSPPPEEEKKIPSSLSEEKQEAKEAFPFLLDKKTEEFPPLTLGGTHDFYLSTDPPHFQVYSKTQPPHFLFRLVLSSEDIQKCQVILKYFSQLKGESAQAYDESFEELITLFQKYEKNQSASLRLEIDILFAELLPPS
jgi:hypothetical protein